MTTTTAPQTSELAPGLAPGTWAVDETHTTVGFVVRHMMVSKVRGSFSDYTASVTIADDPLASQLSAMVQLASVNTGNDDRDAHLRNNDFFDVENHPTMELSSTGLEVADGDLVLHTDLTIKGVTRPVDFALEFHGVGEDPWGGTRAGFSASAEIDRTDFGIEWNAPLDKGGLLVGNKVTIELEVELLKA